MFSCSILVRAVQAPHTLEIRPGLARPASNGCRQLYLYAMRVQYVRLLASRGTFSSSLAAIFNGWHGVRIQDSITSRIDLLHLSIYFGLKTINLYNYYDRTVDCPRHPLRMPKTPTTAPPPRTPRSPPARPPVPNPNHRLDRRDPRRPERHDPRLHARMPKTPTTAPPPRSIPAARTP
jgi:hypothetical protein